jgi:hypothetical protein
MFPDPADLALSPIPQFLSLVSWSGLGPRHLSVLGDSKQFSSPGKFEVPGNT